MLELSPHMGKLLGPSPVLEKAKQTEQDQFTSVPEVAPLRNEEKACPAQSLREQSWPPGEMRGRGGTGTSAGQKCANYTGAPK